MDQFKTLALFVMVLIIAQVSLSAGGWAQTPLQKAEALTYPPAQTTAESKEQVRLLQEVKAEKAKSKNHTIQLTQGENVLQVKKSSAGFFSASISNRTFATVHNGYVTLKSGSKIKRKLFAKAKCPKDSEFCEIKIMVHGEGSLVYGNLYRIFGYENLAVRQVFKINDDLKVIVPKSITRSANTDA